MRFLVDTNILIPLEPASMAPVETQTPMAMEFFRLVQRSKCDIFVHPAVEHDLERDKNTERVAIRRQAIQRYQIIEHPPSSDILDPSAVGRPTNGSNNWVDNQLLASVFGDAVNYLVTEDDRIHRKSRRLGLESRVLHLSEAILLVRELFDKVPPPPPSVRDIYAYQLDETDPIFGSLRADYNNFDQWLKKCKLEHRQVYAIEETPNHCLAGLCILKTESVTPDNRQGKTLKMCTFKVAEQYAGNKYGELLLKAVFDYANANKYNHLYLTAYPKQILLITFAQDFGFEFCRMHGSREITLVKTVRPSTGVLQYLRPFELHIRYGPRVTSFVGNNSFIVPIRPDYHAILFPERESQLSLFAGSHPCGNAIKKAYLCHAAITSLKRGDNLLFYRSHDVRAVTVIGICEDTRRCTNPDDIAQYVGKRTVYSYRQIQRMCSRPVLAVRFRLVTILDDRITLNEMQTAGMLSSAPQSIVKLSPRAVKWLQKRIAF
jgi:GNAT superfamily N-acetyltransferase